MFSYEDLINFVRGPIPERPMPVVYDFAPCFDSMVGGIPSMTKFYFDLEEKMRLQLKLKELFPEALILPGVFPDFGVIAEVSAFGGQIIWLEGNAPFILPCLRDVKDVDTLKIPVPGTTGLTPALLIQKSAMHQKLRGQGKTLEKWALSMGPAEIAGLLLGYDKYYLALYDDPKRIKALLEMVTEFIIRWIHKLGEPTGGNEVIMIADHVCSQIAPQQLSEFVLPRMKSIFDAFSKTVRIYHNEGFHSDQHIETILQFGAHVWHFGSDAHDLSDLYSKIGNAIIPWGGLNPHGALRSGTPEAVRAEARDAVWKAEGRKLLLSSGTGTTPDTPLANMRAMVEVALE
jgi:uroporphyrinogen decarboxylase